MSDKEQDIEEQPLVFRPAEEPKKAGSRLLKILKLLGAAALTAAAIVWLPLFRLQQIEVHGNNYVKYDEVCRISGLVPGMHIFSIRTDNIVSLLEKDLRIETVSVRRLLPNGVSITIGERQALASVPCDYGFVDVDSNGLVLDAYLKPRPGTGRVLISGIKLRDIYVGDTVGEDQLKQVLLFLKTVNAEQRACLTEIMLADIRHIAAKTANGMLVRIGNLERLPEKARLTTSFLQEFGNTAGRVEYVDFQYKSPFIKFHRNN